MGALGVRIAIPSPRARRLGTPPIEQRSIEAQRPLPKSVAWPLIGLVSLGLWACICQVVRLLLAG